MEKIRKGLEEKLNLITKIKSNLKIKKYELKKFPQRQSIQFPVIDKNPITHEKQNHFSNDAQMRNPQNQITAWINIKKIGKDPEHLSFLTPNLSNRKSSTSFDDKILLTNTYTSRFASKNSLMKLVQFKSITKDKSKSNLSVQMLRKTFLQKTSRTFSPEKLQKKMGNTKLPQKDLNFYGKINEINHVSGIRFKTLDPRFGGLTREQLKEKIKNRQNISSLDNNFSTIPLSPRVSQSLNLYQLQASLQQRQQRSSIQAYNFSPYSHRREGRKSRKTKGGPTVNQRYSPWNPSTSEEVLWDQLPKIK